MTTDYEALREKGEDEGVDYPQVRHIGEAMFLIRDSAAAALELRDEGGELVGYLLKPGHYRALIEATGGTPPILSEDGETVTKQVPPTT